MIDRKSIPTLPPLTRIRQIFPRPLVEDVAAATRATLDASGVKPQGEVAIGVGSRGIANLARIVRATVDWVRDQGAHPFIVPAMGSHGGATGEGQAALLAGYGVTSQAMGAPVRAAMDVVELERGQSPVPVYLDRRAHDADGIILVNRIKVHTDYHGTYESGLCKMLAIGLGKQAQAMAIHRYGVQGLLHYMPLVAREVLRQAPVLLGVGLLENAYEETCHIEAVPAAEICRREPELLDHSRTLLPRLPIEDVDVLVIDEMGKDISGVGIDTNIIGRLKVYGQPEPDSPRVKMVVVRDLTEGSHGNALGMGLADIMTRRLFDKIDWHPTYENVFTATYLERAKVPVVAEHDAEALRFALRASGSKAPDEVRLLRIRNTLRLEELHASPAVVRELEGREDIEVAGPVGDVFNGGSRLHEF